MVLYTQVEEIVNDIVFGRRDLKETIKDYLTRLDIDFVTERQRRQIELDLGTIRDLELTVSDLECDIQTLVQENKLLKEEVSNLKIILKETGVNVE